MLFRSVVVSGNDTVFPNGIELISLLPIEALEEAKVQQAIAEREAQEKAAESALAKAKAEEEAERLKLEKAQAEVAIEDNTADVLQAVDETLVKN